jgi:hypothetical protein
MKSQPGARAVLASIVAAAAVVLPGCAATGSASWVHPVTPGAAPTVGPVFVMEPIVAGTASPGNVGRDFAKIRRDVAQLVLSVVQERFPDATVVTPTLFAGVAMPLYEQATGEANVSIEERSAANQASQEGASHLLVPTITEWTEMRTDDPIGALIGPHNRVTVTLRLMRLEPPVLAGCVTFHNRARLTLNRHVRNLLDDDFKRAVRQLVGGAV